MSGELFTGGDDRPTLATDKAIFIEKQFSFTRTPSGGAMVAMSGDPEHHVADFQERTIHGELTDGSRITLVHAQGGSRSLGFLLEPSQARQQFRARYAVIGEHVGRNRCTTRLGFKWSGRLGGEMPRTRRNALGVVTYARITTTGRDGLNTRARPLRHLATSTPE